MLPIGLPIGFQVPLPPLPPSGQICIPVKLPRLSSVVGTTLYLTLFTVTPGLEAPGVVEFTPRFDMPLLETRPVDKIFFEPGHTPAPKGDV